jgi:hypothetical protein
MIMNINLLARTNNNNLIRQILKNESKAKMNNSYTVKNVREFPVLSRDVTTKLSLSGNYDVITELFLPRGSVVSDIPAGDGKLVHLFLRCTK